MQTATQVAGMPPGNLGAAQLLKQAVEGVADEIKTLREQDMEVRSEEMKYGSEEELLVYAEKATDFLILDLEEHFRRYNQRTLPAYDGVRSATRVTKRTSGHVTGSFAEAMCPWVLQRLEISDGTFLRLKSLSPGAFGRVVPDMVMPVGGKKYRAKSSIMQMVSLDGTAFKRRYLNSLQRYWLCRPLKVACSRRLVYLPTVSPVTPSR